MRVFEYLLKFGFMYGVSLGLLLVLAPLMWKNAGETGSNHVPNTRLQELKLFIDVPEAIGAERYLNLQLTDNNGQQYKTFFFVPDGEHRPLAQVLEKYQFISSVENITAELPIVLSHQDQPELLSAVYLEIKNNRIYHFQLGGAVVIGDAGIGRQVFLYLLSIVFGLAGVLSLALTTLALIGNLREYSRIGQLPDLPNSLQSKWKGLKYLLKGFKK